MTARQIGLLCFALSTVGCADADPSDVARAAAERVFQLRGSVRVTQKSGDLTSLTQLPEGPLTIERVDLKEAKITPDDLQKLAGLTHVEYLGLYGTDVSDAAMDHVAALTSLKELELSYTQFTDLGLAKLQKLINLERLYLHGTNDTVSDSAVEELRKDLPKCRIFR